MKVFDIGADGFFGFWSDVQGKWTLGLVDGKDQQEGSIRLVPSPGASIKPRLYDPVETQVPVQFVPPIDPEDNIPSATYFESQGFKDYILQNASLIYDLGSMNDFGICKPQLPENVLKFLFQENSNFRLSNISGGIGTFKEVTYNNIPVVFFDNRVQMTTDILMQLLETKIQDIDKIAIVENRSVCRRFVDNKDLLYKIDTKGDPLCVFLFYKNGQIVRKRLNDPPAYQTFRLDGFAVPETFKPLPFGSLPDSKNHRRTLYWNPDLNTDASGKAKVRLYMSRKDQEIIVSAEGLLQ